MKHWHVKQSLGTYSTTFGHFPDEEAARCEMRRFAKEQAQQNSGRVLPNGRDRDVRIGTRLMRLTVVACQCDKEAPP